jgi:hypothetical protein
MPLPGRWYWEPLFHRTPAKLENSGPRKQRGIDMAPAAPHTRARQARTCASCHTNSKTLGYGTHDGRYLKAYVQGISVDVATSQGEIVSKHAQIQIPPIPERPMDLDQVVTGADQQLQTVGHHWPLSGPLPKEMRDRMEKVGACITCHQHIPSGSFTGVHKKPFHDQVMERTWAPGLTFHSTYEKNQFLPPEENKWKNR